jgi:hypothetical protein
MYMLHCTVLQLEANWYSCRLCVMILSSYQRLGVISQETYARGLAR